MHARAVFLASVLTVSSLTSACGGKADVVTAPTSVRPVQPTPPVFPPADGSCVGTEAQWAIGQRASDDLLNRARVAASAALARFLHPNQPITMEYSGSRLNLELDEREVVRAVRCG
ncbi:MAG: hypothetical protein GEU82_12325 [Luteitalea sp.]|nr:hypothetical protein [Luteitalea sp.]